MQQQWAFEEVIIGLYDCFIYPSSLQDACAAFFTAKYSAETGVQGFYDTLVDHAQNMAEYPDNYTMMEKFIMGLPAQYHNEIFKDGYHMEMNTLDDFITAAKLKEVTEKTIQHYN